MSGTDPPQYVWGMTKTPLNSTYLRVKLSSLTQKGTGLSTYPVRGWRKRRKNTRRLLHPRLHPKGANEGKNTRKPAP